MRHDAVRPMYEFSILASLVSYEPWQEAEGFIGVRSNMHMVNDL
jgi:hypothetical protein